MNLETRIRNLYAQAAEADREEARAAFAELDLACGFRFLRRVRD